MRDLFDRLIIEGEPLLQQLCIENAQEGLELEAKEKNDVSHGQFDKSDKKTLGKALSAFSNSAGGLLIFGIRASKIDGVDAFHELKPISDVRRFASEAKTLTGQLLSPRHDGIEQATIPSSSSAGTGYLVILVERSERRPHMSKAPDDGRYYKRSGDSSFPMEHYDIEDAMRRVVAPAVTLGFDWRPGPLRGSYGDRRRALDLILSLRTENALARFPFLVISERKYFSVPTYGLDGNGRFGLPSTHGETTRFAGGADDVIHPGVSHEVTPLRISITDRMPQWEIEGVPISDFAASARLTFGAAGALRGEFELTISGAEIQTAVRALLPNGPFVN